MFISAIGQDSHRFEADTTDKPLIVGGVNIPGYPGLQGNSDADVVLHAITNAISGLSGRTILGAVSDELCLQQNIRDSKVYLQKALETLGPIKINHISCSVEAKRPRLAPHVLAIRESIAFLCGISVEHVGFTATTGEGLTAFGRGEGILVTVIISAQARDTRD